MASNGNLPESDLAPIAGGRLAKTPAAAWNAMNVQARGNGVELRPTGSRSSYRPYADQQYLWNEYRAGRGNLAARPGTSNHGLGTAVDVATPQMRAMVDRIGERFGWAKKWSDAPSEWWHLTYRSGVWSGKDPGPNGHGTDGSVPRPGGVPELHVDYFDQGHNARHPDVKVWQERMAQRGWKISADGIYGPGSEKVCRSFQSEKGLGADGKVGPRTWAAAWTAGLQ